MKTITEVQEFEKERKKMLSYLENKVYGKWRAGEEVSYEITGEGKAKVLVSREGVQASFDVTYSLPAVNCEKKHCGKYPFFISLHPITEKEAALQKGYAFFTINSIQVAEDNDSRKGAFYDLYPYTEHADSQTGVLMAWAWGAAKLLDAIENGLYKECNLDRRYALACGVSRWGKAVAVLGVFDHRFKMIVPVCSGAAGLALYGVKSEGKTYDLSSVGGPAAYTYGTNEPLSCLQSKEERGWFVDAFLSYRTEEELPYDQDILPKLAAGSKHSYFMVASHMGEDWVNAPAMWECYLLAKDFYEKSMLEGRLFAHFHKEGHALLREDMEQITKAFDELYYPTWWLEKADLIKQYKKANKQATKGQIVFTGSSLMEFFPVEKLAAEAGLADKVYNRGVGGYIADDLMDVLSVCCIDLKPSQVFINIGTNDLSNEDTGVEDLMEKYETILRTIYERVPGVQITMMAYYPVNASCAANRGMKRTLSIRDNERIQKANEAVKDLAQKMNCAFLDVNEPLKDSEGNLKKEFCLDGMHMTEDAYRAIWPLIYRELVIPKEF